MGELYQTVQLGLVNFGGDSYFFGGKRKVEGPTIYHQNNVWSPFGNGDLFHLLPRAKKEEKQKGPFSIFCPWTWKGPCTSAKNVAGASQKGDG